MTEVSQTATVDAFLALFDARWPTPDELRALVAPGVVFVERPNLVNPDGGERDLDGMLAGIEAGRAMLKWQRYDVRDHVAAGSTVVTRMRWSGELANGRVLRAWCVAHYAFDADGRIARIEQHNCYEPFSR